MLPASTSSAPPPETLEVGGWQVVITDGHAVLPEGMTHLPGGAFSGRATLVSVACPESLVSIGSSAFVCCSSLISIDLSASLTSIGSRAFWGCSALASVTLPAGLTSIGSHAFCSCSALASVTLPAGLTSIGSHAFCSCSALASITFPSGHTSIGDHAFADCSSLSRLTFPAGLASIDVEAFADCPLTRVTVPDTATIRNYAFPRATTVLRLPPKRMRDLQRWYEAVDGTLAYKRCLPLLYGWLERAQTRLGSYGPNGAARKRDREEFEADFALATARGPD